MDFAVQVRDEEEGKGRWVLAVDALGGRLLVTRDDRSLEWVPMHECKFMRAATPDTPTLVMAVQPAPQAQAIAVPKLHINGGRRGA
ncbi:MAG: hypothetical protein Q8R28_18085 [Dehalococcoidia bacterium]|nr:hypothetical protein [Dehalococcoidia bacterium]